MSTPTVRVTGLRQAVRSLERMGAEVTDLKAAMYKVGSLIRDEAKANAPVLSGATRQGIRAGRGKGKVSVQTAKNDYAEVIHWGWDAHNIAPQPYLYDAAQDKQEEATELLADELDQIANKLDL